MADLSSSCAVPEAWRSGGVRWKTVDAPAGAGVVVSPHVVQLANGGGVSAVVLGSCDWFPTAGLGGGSSHARRGAGGAVGSGGCLLGHRRPRRGGRGRRLVGWGAS